MFCLINERIAKGGGRLRSPGGPGIRRVTFIESEGRINRMIGGVGCKRRDDAVI